MKIWTCSLLVATLTAGLVGGIAVPAKASPAGSFLETIAGAIGDVIGAVAAGTAGIGDGNKTKRIKVRCDGDKIFCSGDDWNIKDAGTRAWLGVHLQDLDSELREAMDLNDEDGVLISDVIEDSPAEKAGLEDGDVVYRIDDRDVRSAHKLAKYIKRKDPGDEVEVFFYRDGKKKSRKIELAEKERRVSRTIHIHDDDDPWSTGFEILMRPRLGVVVQSLDEDLASYFDVEEGEGVLVTKVMENTPAKASDIKTGDVIVKVGDHDVSEAEDIREALTDFDAGDNVRVEIVRKGKKRDIDVELEEDSMTSFSNHDFWFDHGSMHPAPFVKPLPHIRIEELLDEDDFEDFEEELEEMKEELRELREELKKMRKSRNDS
jgi:C-terminal processing protease CtpA/Prc